MNRDRNLLFGVLAVQLKRVTSTQLVDAAGAWATDRSRSLASCLVAQGALSDNDRSFIEDVLERAVADHGGDAGATLATFGGDAQVYASFRGSIVPKGDDDIVSPDDKETVLAEADDDDSLGVQEAPGRYTHMGEFGRGGMGRVLLVHDGHLARNIAMKELLPESSGCDSRQPTPVRKSLPMVARFLQEARITGQLEHPSIVPVYELGYRKDGTLYYTMKLVRGRTLAQAINEAESLQERLKLLPHFVDLCNAIAYAHNRHVIHRDIKPANVMVGDFGETVVLDWGLARSKNCADVHAEDLAETLHAMRPQKMQNVRHTLYGHALGTPAYMPPEQAMGHLDEIDERSDVYSLGAVLYELLTGQVPFRGDGVADTLRLVLESDAVPVTARVPHAPVELAAVCERAMRKKKKDRFDSAAGLSDEIARFQSGALLQSYRYGLSEHLKRWATKNKAAISAATAALIVILLAAGYSHVSVLQANRAERAQRIVAEEARADAEARAIALEKAAYVSAIRQAQNHIDHNERDLARQRLLQAPEEFRNWEWGYLYAALDQSLHTLAHDARGMRAAAYSPDGNRIVTVGDDTNAKVWDAETGQCVVTLRHTHKVESAEFDSTGTHILTLCPDHEPIIWDAETGRRIHVLSSGDSKPRLAHFSPDGRYVATVLEDGTALLWETHSGVQAALLPGSNSQVFHAVFSPDGRSLVIACKEQIFLWQIPEGTLLGNLKGHGYGISPVFSPDGMQVILWEPHRPIRVWATATAADVTTLEETEWFINSIAAFSPDGCSLLTTASDCVMVRDAKTGTLRKTLAGHRADVLDASYSRDGRYIITASRDQTAKVWDAETGDVIRTLAGHNGPVSRAVFSPQGDRILTMAWGQSAKIWDAHENAQNPALLKHDGAVDDATFSVDGRRVLTASMDKTARIWDVASGQNLNVLAGHSGSVAEAIFMRDCQQVITKSTDGTAKLWNIASDGKARSLLTMQGVICAAEGPGGLCVVAGSNGRQFSILNAESGHAYPPLTSHEAAIAYVELSPNGHLLTAIDHAGTVTVWEVESGLEVARLSKHGEGFGSVGFSPTGRYIATVAYNGSINVWESAGGEERAAIPADPKGTLKVSFSPSERYLVTTSRDKTAYLWVIATGEEHSRFAGHTSQIVSVQFSQDEQRLITAGLDGTARIWDVETGQELVSLVCHDGEVKACFGPDGQQVLTAGGDNAARIWSAAPWRVRAWADDATRPTLIRLAQREVPEVSRTTLNPLAPDFLEQLEGVGNLFTGLAATALHPVANQGLLAMEDVVLLPSEGIALHKGDLITVINGQLVDSLAVAQKCVRSSIHAFQSRENSQLELEIEILSPYARRAEIFEVPPIAYLFGIIVTL